MSKNSPQERLAICKQCKDFDWLLGRCKICGCFVRAKVMLEEESCPVDKWR